MGRLDQQPEDVLRGYAAAATADLIAAYDSLSSADIYVHVRDLFPIGTSRVADLGAGTGRDAAWFAGSGHDVVAVEPVRELREAGQALHTASNIRWLDDRLPDLALLSAHCLFDLVTVCAVWQHLNDENRAISMPRLAAIVAPAGILVMSLRHGPGAIGRKVFPVAPEVTVETAQACGLDLLRRRDAGSVQATNQAMGVSWTWLVFQKAS